MANVEPIVQEPRVQGLVNILPKFDRKMLENRGPIGVWGSRSLTKDARKNVGVDWGSMQRVIVPWYERDGDVIRKVEYHLN